MPDVPKTTGAACLTTRAHRWSPNGTGCLDCGAWQTWPRPTTATAIGSGAIVVGYEGMSDLVHLARSLSFTPHDPRIPSTLLALAGEIERLHAIKRATMRAPECAVVVLNDLIVRHLNAVHDKNEDRRQVLIRLIDDIENEYPGTLDSLKASIA